MLSIKPFASFLLIFALSFNFAFAAPPAGGYTPGSELDPDCSPGTSDCTVNFSVEALDTDLTSGSVLFSDGSNVSQDNSKLFWDNLNNRLGIGTTTPASALDILGNITMTGSIIPTVDNTYSLGSETMQWKDVFIGPGSLYVNGQKVIEEELNNIVFSADINQSVALRTTGTGDIEINPAGTGKILLKSNTEVSGGKTITTSDGTALSFPYGIVSDGFTIDDNAITTNDLNAGISLTPNGTGGVYVTSGNFGVGTTGPDEKLTVSSNANPSIKIESEDQAGTSYTLLEDTATSQLRLDKYTNTGATSIDVNPIPVDTLSNAIVKFFRYTETAGNRLVQFFRGDNSTTVDAQIGVGTSDSFFNVGGGNVGIGLNNPSQKLNVSGNGLFTGTLTASNLSGTNTGDETESSIKTALGITTLSGSNTGDETVDTIKTKLGITTLSGSNTGDQDLSGLALKTTTISAGTGLSGGGDLSTNRTITLADTAVTPGAYTNADITVDQQGRITAAASGSASSQWATAGSEIYYNTGNVGIGNTDPETALDVAGVIKAQRVGVPEQQLRVDSGDGSGIYLTGQSLAGAEKGLYIRNFSGEATAGANNNIRFLLGTSASPSEKMRISSEGYLGVGTASPDWKLHVVDPTYAVGSFETYSATADNRSIFLLNRARGTEASPVLVQDGDTIGSIQGNAYNGTAFSNSTLIGFYVDGTFTSGQRPPGRIVLSTAPAGGAISTRIGISSDGEITMPAVYADTVGATNRDLFIDNTGKLGYVASSERYKENIEDLGNISEKLYSLRPVIFDYKDASWGTNQYGLIAEEVENVMPEIVSYNEEKQPETVNYDKLLTPMLNEMQKMHSKILELEDRIAELEDELDVTPTTYSVPSTSPESVIEEDSISTEPVSEETPVSATEPVADGATGSSTTEEIPVGTEPVVEETPAEDFPIIPEIQAIWNRNSMNSTVGMLGRLIARLTP